ncbi:hypothetical protein MAR_006877, partial [Mya arenaria]
SVLNRRKRGGVDHRLGLFVGKPGPPGFVGFPGEIVEKGFPGYDGITGIIGDVGRAGASRESPAFQVKLDSMEKLVRWVNLAFKDQKGKWVKRGQKVKEENMEISDHGDLLEIRDPTTIGNKSSCWQFNNETTTSAPEMFEDQFNNETTTSTPEMFEDQFNSETTTSTPEMFEDQYNNETTTSATEIIEDQLNNGTTTIAHYVYEDSSDEYSDEHSEE